MVFNHERTFLNLRCYVIGIVLPLALNLSKGVSKFLWPTFANIKRLEGVWISEGNPFLDLFLFFVWLLQHDLFAKALVK